MKNFSLNHYELAFGNWLIDNHVQYISVDEGKRAAFGRGKIKSFDYLLYPPNQKPIVAEIKGRKFKGNSFANLSGFECWVTMDDIDGLTAWKKVFGHSHISAFVFVYKIENVDVDFDGRETYYFDEGRYIFFVVRLEDYCSNMTIRSPKWRTVTLPADKFRKFAIQTQNLLL